MHAVILSQLITNLVFFPSSSASLMTAATEATVRKLDESIRDDLLNLGWMGHTFLWWLIASSIVVAVGVAFEGPEVIHDLSPIVRRWLRRPKPLQTGDPKTLKEDLIKVAGFAGWFLVVIGVIGEGIFEGLENRAQGLLQTFNDISLVAAQRESGDAIERASYANERASDNEQESEQLKKDAERLRRDAESEKLQRVQLEALVGPRRLTIDEQKRIGKACASLYTYGPTKRIQVSSYGLDGEGAALAIQIGAALNSGPLYTSLGIGNIIVTGGFETGVIISAPPEDDNFATCLKSALTNIGGLADVQVNPERHAPGGTMSGTAVMSGNAMMGGGGHITPAAPLAAGSAVEIFVGIKPDGYIRDSGYPNILWFQKSGSVAHLTRDL